MIFIRLQSTVHWLSFGPGIFGWTAIQVHANMMAKQLHIMLDNDLVPYILSVGGSMAVRSEKAPMGRVKAHEI